jgi:hypothetical protein
LLDVIELAVHAKVGEDVLRNLYELFQQRVAGVNGNEYKKFN